MKKENDRLFELLSMKFDLFSVQKSRFHFFFSLSHSLSVAPALMAGAL